MGINRNIVECKLISPSYLCLLCLVLIETLWNVNYTVGMTLDGAILVLIETLWNVN